MIGKFACSGKGHDKGTLYVIVSCDERYVWLADGRIKKLAAPKKKNRKHIQIINKKVSEDLIALMKTQDAGADDRIRAEIRMYSQNQSEE